MKRHCLISLFFILALFLLTQAACQQRAKVPAGPSAAQDQAEAVRRTSQPGPKISFEKVVHEFGEVTAKKKYMAKFEFTNTGQEVLRITEVKRCCGVVTKLDKKEFEPGESGVLEVEYVSGPNASVMRRLLYVSSNDPANPKVELTLKAKVVPKVVYEPQRLELVLKEENAGCPNITLTSLDNQPFAIKAFQSTGQSITADVDPSVEATKFVLKPVVDFEKLKTRSVGFVSIDLTHAECSRVYLSFSTLLRFQFTPRSIILFNPESKKPIVKRLSLASNYNEDFEIESTSSEKGIAKVLSQEKTDKGYQFEVEVTPPPNDENGRFTDVLYLHLDDGEKLSIKCYVRYADLEK